MRLRTGASIAAVALAASLLGGCSLFAEAQTQHPYDASDGVSVSVGDVRLLNALVITEDGVDGNLSAAAVNSGDRSVQLLLQYVSDGDKVDIQVALPAGQTVTLGSGEYGQVFLPGIDTTPGSLLTVYVQYGSEPGKQVSIPVLDASLPEYGGLIPTPTPTPTPTETPGEGATPTPTPTP